VTKGQSRHEEIAAGIRERIQSGALKPGDRAVASLDTAAAGHHVAVGTIREALRLLADEGLVVTRPGIGTIVRDPGAGANSRSRSGAGHAAEHDEMRADISDLQVKVAELWDNVMARDDHGQRKERSDEQAG
jgi:DNA-binding GntR family transcriptional regulator